MQFRFENNIDPKKIWTLEDLNELRKSNILKNNLLNQYDNNFLLYLFNNIAQNNSKKLSNYAAKGGPLNIKYKTGDIYPESTQCAYFSNHLLNDNGYMISGDAWTPRGIDMVYNGFDTLSKPTSYNIKDYDAYNKAAINNFYKNFDSTKSLDPSKPYVVNMYNANSKKKQMAFNEGKDVYGTHTGVLSYDPINKT